MWLWSCGGVSPPARCNLCPSELGAVVQGLHKTSGISWPWHSAQGGMRLNLAVIRYGWHAVSHLGLVLFLFSCPEQQVTKITELAREKQTAELKALKESSER